ncbi:SusC/RagA family TonB-linked outer membrane protein [Sunxiuqinia sp. A32]|uniref:SusC/RagA family TonB-linked outer membrane protein n=1 Tax=Sunxiuqinia sp. A32 TaxID=3461496 RepID=UPI004045D315
MKKIALLLAIFAFGLQSVFAQTKEISGTVTSADDGSTIPGVSVSVKGTTLGTITDLDGKYTLKVPQDAQTLVLSFVGMETQDVAIVGSIVNVVLKSETIGINEVVVTALGIKRSEKSLGYATQSVDGGELNEAPENNLINSLNGKIAGVHITNSSGAVGSSSRIVLRGASSIFGDIQPLFIVDGVPISNNNDGTTTNSGGFDMPNGVADIDPNNIESINVLKGPSAAALYGIRASNGVVVITTKKGTKSTGLGVEITQNITFENPLVIPSFQNSYGQGSSKDFFEYINGTSGDGGVDESWGPPLDVGLNFMQYTSYIKNPDNPQPQPWVSHPNNVKNFYETGLTSRTNVSLTGGNETTTFRLDAGYSDQTGMIPFTDFKKLNLNAVGTHDLSDKLSATFGIKFIKSDSDNLPNSGYDGSNVVQQTIWSGRNVDLEILKDWRNLPKALPGSTYGAGTLPISWNTQFQNNPYWQLETNRNVYNKNRYIGNVGLSYIINDWMNISGNVGLDNYVTKTSVRWAKGSSGDAPTYWRFGSAFNRSGQDGFYDEDENSFFQSNMEVLLNIDKSINDDFKIMASIGGGMVNTKTTWDYRAVQLELPDLYNLGNVKSGTTMVSRNRHSESAINSVFGSAELSYKEYLFFNVTGRNDWASVLPLQNNSFFYPSFTLSGILSDILKIQSNTLSLLKVRGSWAEVGGFGPLGPSDILPVYQLSSSPWAGNTFGFFPTTLNNANIKSQTTTGMEGGLEVRMFQNRLRFDFTYYDQTNTDLVIPVQVTNASGVSSVWDNIGETNNKGVEIQLGGTLVETSNNDFSIDMQINFAKNKNMVVKAGKDEENDEESLILGNMWETNLEAREGYPYGVLVGGSLARTPAGQVIYENGLPVAGDIKVLGDIQPDWTGGVNLAINYKGLSFTSLVDAKIGGDIYSMTTTWGRTAGVLEETLEGRETGIVGDGVMLDDNGNYVPNDVVVSAENFNHNSYDATLAESSVFDASYVKLRQLSLSYNLPKAWVTRIGLKNVNVALIGRNLAILYKKAPHIDPESGFDNSNSQQGFEFGQLPSARSYGVSLNVKF